jgi:hypothetical protein
MTKMVRYILYFKRSIRLAPLTGFCEIQNKTENEMLVAGLHLRESMQ